MDKENLKSKLIEALKEQGFQIGPNFGPGEDSKETYRKIQQKAKESQLSLYRDFLMDVFPDVKNYIRNGSDIVPENISLELREIKPGSFEDTLSRWWNIVWWSIPYQRPYGRQMRYLLWDKTHDAPFGLLVLQSPVLKMAIRDDYLGIPKNELDIWVNRSMTAQRVGAFPPYNMLLGGKMVALSLTCNEIRDAYRKKYENYVSIIKKRKLVPDLLFITTTSAFGKSSLYNRLKYGDEIVAESLGYTKGSGTFHIPEDLYQEIINLLKEKGVDTRRGYGHGPSRKLRLIGIGLRYLGLSNFQYHGIKRELYLFPLAKNLKEVIQKGEEPIWFDRPFDKLVDYWKERWAIPRSKRFQDWKNFNSNEFLEEIKQKLEEVEDGRNK
jgi:hypothetical protein